MKTSGLLAQKSGVVYLDEGLTSECVSGAGVTVILMPLRNVLTVRASVIPGGAVTGVSAPASTVGSTIAKLPLPRRLTGCSSLGVVVAELAVLLPLEACSGCLLSHIVQSILVFGCAEQFGRRLTSNPSNFLLPHQVTIMGFALR